MKIAACAHQYFPCDQPFLYLLSHTVPASFSLLLSRLFDYSSVVVSSLAFYAACRVACCHVLSFAMVIVHTHTGGVYADVGGARIGHPDPGTIDAKNPAGRGCPQPDTPGVLRVVSREARLRQGAHLQGRRVSYLFKTSCSPRVERLFFFKYTFFSHQNAV